MCTHILCVCARLAGFSQPPTPSHTHTQHFFIFAFYTRLRSSLYRYKAAQQPVRTHSHSPPTPPIEQHREGGGVWQQQQPQKTERTKYDVIDMEYQPKSYFLLHGFRK